MRIKLREMRMKRGMTQGELARRSGVPQPAICEIETGATIDPKLSTMVKLSDTLHCYIEDMIERETKTA